MREPLFARVEELYEKNREKFDLFYSLLSEYNQRYNLTAISEREEVKIKHFYDSLAGEYLFPQGALVSEVGSGGGFPSVPLMIARPDLKFLLIESTGKKCEFLRVVKEALSLNAEIVNGRAEELAQGAYRERADVCCARAVAKLNTLAEYCLPLVKKGGCMVAYKGAEDETESAARAVRILGGGEICSVRYELPEGMGTRTLVRIEKCASTPAKYPRGRGKERKEPL